MTKKWITINLLLLVITGLLGWRLHVSVLRFNAENDLARIQHVPDIKQKIVPEKPLPQLVPAKNYLPAELAVIPEKNIFSESRSKEEKTEAAAPPETPPLTQKPVLVGVNIADNQQKALIIDSPNAPQDRNRRAQIRRIGDVYRGYTITSITLDRIVLESGTRREIIPLHEGSKRSQAGKTPIVSTRVVSFSGGGVSGGTSVSAGSSSVARTPVAASQPAKGQAGQASPAQQQAQPTQQSPNTGTAAPGTGMRTIKTPFGTITRPIN
jgi:hypothetical protein